MNLSEYDEVISAYKTYILDFWYRWPQVRSFLRPPHYKSMFKKSTPLYLLWHIPIWLESYRIGQLWTIPVKICIAYPSKGHLRSPEVTNRHLPITFDQNEIETWDWCQYVRLGQTNHVIWPISVITWPWPDLTWGQTLTLTFQSHFIYGSTRLNERNTMVSNSLLCLSKLKILLSKNRFGKFSNFDPWWPQFWHESKNDRNDFEMLFRELSNAAFRFSLRRPGSEIMGGGAFKRPPPSRWWKIQRPSRARVKKQFGDSDS